MDSDHDVRATADGSSARASSAACEPQSQREVRIVSGAHRDAVFSLSEGDLVVVGADESCDIRLIDAGVAPRHAALLAQRRAGAADLDVSIRQLEGSLGLNGEPVAASARATLQPGAEIELGDSGVKLQLVGAIVAQPSRPKSEKPARSRLPRRTQAIAIATFAMIVVAGVGVTTQRLSASRPAPPPSQTRVASNPTISGEELVEQVKGIFRAYGYQAELSYIGDRRVQVENLDERHERVQQAAARVRSDVPLLAELVFATPDASPPPEQPRPYADAGEGRISARVDGDTAYLATPNGGRYFVGSVLPGGQTVRRITAEAVQLERDGEIAWFRF